MSCRVRCRTKSSLEIVMFTRCKPLIKMQVIIYRRNRMWLGYTRYELLAKTQRGQFVKDCDVVETHKM